jgi:hypothetical protein
LPLELNCGALVCEGFVLVPLRPNGVLRTVAATGSK